jgi:hypothetical protein
MKHNIDRMLDEIRRELPAAERNRGEALYNQGNCTLLSWSPVAAEFAVGDGDERADKKDRECSLFFEGEDGAEKIIPGKMAKRETGTGMLGPVFCGTEKNLKSRA